MRFWRRDPQSNHSREFPSKSSTTHQRQTDLLLSNLSLITSVLSFTIYRRVAAEKINIKKTKPVNSPCEAMAIFSITDTANYLLINVAEDSHDNDRLFHLAEPCDEHADLPASFPCPRRLEHDAAHRRIK